MSADVAIAAPLLMLILVAITQFALWSYATQLAQTAAASGLAAARVHTATAAAGETRARQVLTELGPGPLRDINVNVTRTDEQARVDISGHATSVLPFLQLPVRATAAGPVERFVPNVYEFTNSEVVSGGNRSAGGR
jgi:hypothetical protein